MSKAPRKVAGGTAKKRAGKTAATAAKKRAGKAATTTAKKRAGKVATAKKRTRKTAIPRNKIVLGDCVSAMARLPAKSVDLVVTDPPFAIDFKAKRSNYNRMAGRVLTGYNEIAAADYAEFSKQWLNEARRLLKDTGSVFVFSGWNNLKDVLIAADDAGFTLVNHIIWKYQFGVFCRRRFVSSHYHCLFLCADDRQRKFNLHARHAKAERKTNGGSVLYADLEDVWTIPREYWTGDKKTPTKLPAELVRKILAYTSDPGDLVLDPFLGSGQVAVIAKMMKRDYLGYEIVPEYYEFARERLVKNVYRVHAESKRESHAAAAGG